MRASKHSGWILTLALLGAACGDEAAQPPEPPAPQADVGPNNSGEPEPGEPEPEPSPEPEPVPEPNPDPQPDPQPEPTPEPEPEAQPSELELIPIEVRGRLARPDAQISSLAWFGDILIALPRHPVRFTGEARGVVFSLRQDQILGQLRGQVRDPLVTTEIAFDAPELEAAIEGYAGFEAIAFDGFSVFLTVKTITEAGVGASLLKGELSRDLRTMTIDVASAVALPTRQTALEIGYEGLARFGREIVALPGLNGAAFSTPGEPLGVFDGALMRVGELSMAPLELRLADATEPELDGSFWVINRGGSDEEALRVGPDPLVERYGEVGSHVGTDATERLVAMRRVEGRIELVDRPPILVRLADRNRRWEGVVKLGGEGFLLITNGQPGVIFGFVGRL